MGSLASLAADLRSTQGLGAPWHPDASHLAGNGSRVSFSWRCEAAAFTKGGPDHQRMISMEFEGNAAL